MTIHKMHVFSRFTVQMDRWDSAMRAGPTPVILFGSTFIEAKCILGAFTRASALAEVSSFTRMKSHNEYVECSLLRVDGMIFGMIF